MRRGIHDTSTRSLDLREEPGRPKHRHIRSHHHRNLPHSAETHRPRPEDGKKPLVCSSNLCVGVRDTGIRISHRLRRSCPRGTHHSLSQRYCYRVNRCQLEHNQKKLTEEIGWSRPALPPTQFIRSGQPIMGWPTQIPALDSNPPQFIPSAKR